MKLKNEPYRLHLFILLFLFCFLFESCKEKEQVLLGKLEQVASNGTGLVSFTLKGSKTELREFPKAFFDSLKSDIKQPFNFKYKKNRGNEFASLENVDGGFIISFGSMFPPHAEPNYTHKKYHTFKNITSLFAHPDTLHIWEMTTDKPGGNLLDTLVFNDLLHSIIAVTSGLDTIYIHVNDSPVYLQKNLDSELSSPLMYKVVSNISFDAGHPHQMITGSGDN